MAAASLASVPAAASAVKPAVASAPATKVAAPAAAPAVAVTTRFALEMGPFTSAAEAERVERVITQAGFPTVRSRQATGPALYAVLLERIPGATEAQALVGTLREQGLAEATVIRQDPAVVRAAEPLPLRRAVELAERLRAGGHQVRVAAQPGESAYTIRHGTFPSQAEADARAEELARLGLAPKVVQVR